MKKLAFILLLAGLVGAQTLQQNQTSFVGGEISPLYTSRMDNPHYDAACRTLENAMVLDVGVAARRPGSVYVTKAPGAARLEPFIYDENDIYVMEFSHNLLRFYREGGIVLSGASAYSVDTPWDGNDVFDLNIYQKGDVLYVAHKDYSPRKIVRSSHASWSITDCNTLIDDGPFKDENTDTSVTIDPPDLPSDTIGISTPDANNVYSTYAASKAMDNLLTWPNAWMSDEIEDTWLRFTYASGKVIKSVRIWNYLSGNLDAGVRHCKIQASNDGTDWTDIPVIRWYGRCQGYGSGEIEIDQMQSMSTNQDYAWVYLDNDTSYTQYRIWCYDNWGDASYLGILEVEMFLADSAVYTASSALFSADHVGSLWKLRQPKSETEITGSFTANAQFSPPIYVHGNWDLVDRGTWSGSVSLQRSYDYGATWETFRTWISNPIDATGEETSTGVWYRLAMTTYSSGTFGFSLSLQDGMETSIIRVTGYSDSRHITAEVVDNMNNRLPTYRWSEGAWSENEGYPETVTGHQNRVVFAKGLTLWWSAAYDFENFEAGTNDDQAFTFSLTQSRQSPIRWMVGDRGQGLIAGTLGRILEIQPMDELQGFTPTNPPKVRSSVAIGASKVQPALAEDLMLYANSNSKRIYEMMYNTTSDSVNSADVTLLASHICNSGVVQLAFQANPYPYLWAVRSDGVLSTLYYSRTYQVAAWSRQITDGLYTSVAVVPQDGEADRVWAVVKRTIDGSDVYYVEYFKDIDLDADIQDCWYVDSGLSADANTAVVPVAIAKSATATITLNTGKYSNNDQVRITSVSGMTQLNDGVYTLKGRTSVSPNYRYDLYDATGAVRIDTSAFGTYTSGGLVRRVENTFGGLTHLEGEEVAILAEGSYYGTETVASGSVTLDDYYNYDEVIIGLPYTTTITPVALDLATSSGATVPFLKRETALYLNFYRSMGGKYGPTATNLKEIGLPRSSTPNALVEVPELYTGPFVVRTFSGSRREAGYTVIQDEPYPFVLKSMVTLYEAGQ